MKPTLNFHRAQRFMKERELDALLATSKRNVAYLGDSEALSGELSSFMGFKLSDNGIPYRQAAMLFADSEEIPWWVNAAQIREPGGAISRFETWEEVAKEVKRRGLDRARIGVEDMHLPYRDFDALRELLPDIEFADASMLFLEIRMGKTSAEVAVIREACAIPQDAIAKAFDAIGDDVPLSELDRVFQNAVVAKGAICPVYCLAGHIRCTKPNPDGSAVTYSLFSHPDVRIGKGDLIQMDMSVDLKGYYSDISRMACCGRPDGSFLEMLDVSRQVARAILDAVKPGIRGSELFEIGCEATRAKPYFDLPDVLEAMAGGGEVRKPGRYFFHNLSLGHGVGREVHELPYIAPDIVDGVPDPPLEPNMVMTVEASTTSRAVCNIEDTILVTDDAYEFLTTIDRDLYVR